MAARVGDTTIKAPGKTAQRRGIAKDGGKDSLRMAARVGNKTVKAPGKTDQRLGIAIDGGKSPLSMAVRVGNTTLKAPGKTAETGDSHRWGQRFSEHGSQGGGYNCKGLG